MTSRLDIARAIVLVCHRLAQKGFVTATDGNVSGRLPNGNILITPTALNKGKVTESDLVEVTAEGTPVTLSRAPSTELDLHRFIYRRRADVHAVVHAHPPYATGFAVARVPLTDPVLPEVILSLGTIPLAPYATPATPEVAESLTPLVASSDVFLLANHGVVASGADAEQAYFKLEKTEHAAQIILVARLLGGAHLLTDEQVRRLRSSAPPGAAPDDRSEHEVKQLIREILNEQLNAGYEEPRHGS